MSSLISSAPSRAVSREEPTMSMKATVTWRRSASSCGNHAVAAVRADEGPGAVMAPV